VTLRTVSRSGSTAAVLAAALALAACSSSGGDGGGRTERVIPDVPDLSTVPPGDPWGRLPSQKAVYLFSQSGSAERDAQVLQFSDAVLMRAWQKWDRSGLAAADYDFGYVDAARARNITFVAGGTASVLFQDENPALFRDWATRDAQGNMVEHAYIVPGAYRASLANPGFRRHLLDYLEIQIDGGVDGVFLDEANGGGYTGGTRWSWNGNEGYDDWFLAAFDAFLMAEHPAYGLADWTAAYGMTADNAIQAGVAPGDLGINFDYRYYLQQNGWDRYPADPSNPLAPVWGPIEGNRLDPASTSFRGRALLHYWREMVAELREYARATYGREILVTSNGLFPFVDFNGFGLYEGNRDDDGREAVWVPMKDGHLDGAHSQQDLYRKVRARSQAFSGDVPLVLFLDWPTRTIDAYYGLSLQEKKDYWRIFGAEAYANGLYFAFHLKTTMPGEPTASDSGILDFLETYVQFYQANAAAYTGTAPTDAAVSTSAANVSASVSAGGGKTYLHLVNHNYAAGLVAQEGFTASFPLATAPTHAVLRTPDAAGERTLSLGASGGNVTVTVDRLESYDLVELE
jgi:hypothetical protein